MENGTEKIAGLAYGGENEGKNPKSINNIERNTNICKFFKKF